ncbi:MAG: V-type ATPase subunit [Symbiobacteriaceae bacterium]|nr:V-type ATPase subunit [Symbiobacteriaceae bacterium]
MPATPRVYPLANTIASLEDSRLLKQKEYTALLATNSLQSALDELNIHNYFRTYSDADVYNYGHMLDELMRSVFSLLREITPTEAIWRLFTLLYDIHNIKLVVKERHLGINLSDLFLDYGSYTLPTIHSATVRAEDDILDNPSLTAGMFAALTSEDFYGIDFILDQTYFLCLSEIAAGLKSTGISTFVTEKTDLFNVSVMLQWFQAGRPEEFLPRALSALGRFTVAELLQPLDDLSAESEDPLTFEDCRSFFPLLSCYESAWRAPGDLQALTTDLDVQIDNYLIERSKACKMMPFGVEPICALFFNKFMEIKNVRTLLAGKKLRLSAREIARRLRIPYEM